MENGGPCIALYWTLVTAPTVSQRSLEAFPACPYCGAPPCQITVQSCASRRQSGALQLGVLVFLGNPDVADPHDPHFLRSHLHTRFWGAVFEKQF